MATDNAFRSSNAPMTISELVAYTKSSLESDAERARLQASSADVLPAESQAGTTLDLSSARIQALPVEVLVLIKDRVERLALSHNRQISIPSQIVQCERLRYLNIRWNELIQFPRAILQLSNLEILDLSKNAITSIPEDINRLSSLRFLAISNNKVTRLPLAIGDMTNLGRLKVEDNPIEFPPPEVFKPPKSSRIDVSRSSDVCQNVKRFLKDTANKQKQKLASEDESSESNVETPRPPKRTATGGRFPIRPSISGIEGMPDPRVDSPNDHTPPIPQRSHARMGSSNSVANTSATMRPTTAISANGKGDGSRSRSETASSTASLRQRRQGFVQPSRKATGDLTLVPENASQAADRASKASTIKASHSRAPSSASMINGHLATGSNGSVTDMTGSTAISRRMSGSYDALESTKRLLFTLRRLQQPINEITGTLVYGTLKRSLIENKAQSAQSILRELDMLFHRLQNSLERGTTTNAEAMKAIVRISARVLKSYGSVVGEIKRHSPTLIKSSDGFVVRGLMHQLWATNIEVQNICSVLGFKLKHKSSSKEKPRISQAWSSKSVTPTQPKAPVNNPRLRNATSLQNTNSPPIPRGPPPPSVPLNTNISRTNTMTSLSAATPRSGDTFQLHSPKHPPSRPSLSRTNTMRSMMDGGENDEQFDHIFIVLKQTCDAAGQALPHCRNELADRREQSQHAGHRGLAQQWTGALKKCDFTITHNKALKKRLETHDPGARYQRDFWLACDAFVHSWTELATVVKDIGSQRVDIEALKQYMRNVQRMVKDASKMISLSPLYHHAIGSKGPEAMNLAPPFPSGINSGMSSTSSSFVGPTSAPGGPGGAQGNYVVGPATPLSAAIGPAAHSIQPPPGEHGGQSGSRPAHERVDTVTQPPPRQQSRRQQ